MATSWLARAKVNLVLDVVGLRPDGYHELRTVFQSIDLSDVLTLEPATDIEVTCDLPGIPEGPGNLAFRAAALLRERLRVTRGARIRIHKRIPAGAGLGGGSADAAATLVGLNDLWQLGLGTAELHDLGALLGSDVPFMISGGTAIGTGRGEILTPAACAGPFPLAVVMPALAVGTAGAYRALDAWPALSHPDPEPALAALAAGDWPALSRSLGNSFAAPIAAREPEIDDALAVIRAVAGDRAVMSGSGAALVVVAPTAAQVSELRQRLPACAIWAGSSASAGVSPLTEN